MITFTLEQVQAQAAKMLEAGNQEVYARLHAITSAEDLQTLVLPEQEQLIADMAL